MASARNVLLKLTGDPSDAKRALDDVSGDLKSFDRITAEARATIETEGAKAKLARLNDQLQRLSRQEATPDVKIKSAGIAGQINRIEKQLDGIKDRTVDVRVRETGADGKAGGRGGNLGLAGLAGAGGKLGPAGAAAAIGVGATALSLKAVAGAAAEAEITQKRLEAQLKASGISYEKNAGQIDKVIQATSNLSGLDDEDLTESFTNIVRATGDVKKSLDLVGLASDIARAKNIDVAKAGELVAKVATGNTGILKRYGVVVKEGATAQEGLAAAQKAFGGQAESYGKTAAGAQDRFRVASENLKESIGVGLTPILASLAETAVRVVERIQEEWPRIAATFRTGVAQVKKILKGLGDAIDGAIDFVKKLNPGFRRQFNGVIRIVRGFVRIVKGIFHGDFREVFNGLKDIVTGGLNAVRGTIRSAIEPFRRVGKALANGIGSGFKAGFKAIKTIVVDALNELIKIANKGLGVVDAVLPGKQGKIGLIGPDGDPTKDSPVRKRGTGAVTDNLGVPGRLGRFPRSAAGDTFNITVPGGGPPDPRALAVALARERGRRP